MAHQQRRQESAPNHGCDCTLSCTRCAETPRVPGLKKLPGNVPRTVRALLRTQRRACARSAALPAGRLAYALPPAAWPEFLSSTSTTVMLSHPTPRASFGSCGAVAIMAGRSHQHYEGGRNGAGRRALHSRCTENDGLQRWHVAWGRTVGSLSSCGFPQHACWRCGKRGGRLQAGRVNAVKTRLRDAGVQELLRDLAHVLALVQPQADEIANFLRSRSNRHVSLATPCRQTCRPCRSSKPRAAHLASGRACQADALLLTA